MKFLKAILAETWLLDWPAESLGLSRTPAEFRSSEPLDAAEQHYGRKGRSRRSGGADAVFGGYAISRGADRLWYVDADPTGLGYSTLQDAMIAVQFMGRAA